MCAERSIDIMLSYSFSFAVYGGSHKTKDACTGNKQQSEPKRKIAVITGFR